MTYSPKNNLTYLFSKVTLFTRSYLKNQTQFFCVKGRLTWEDTNIEEFVGGDPHVHDVQKQQKEFSKSTWGVFPEVDGLAFRGYLGFSDFGTVQIFHHIQKELRRCLVGPLDLWVFQTQMRHKKHSIGIPGRFGHLLHKLCTMQVGKQHAFVIKPFRKVHTLKLLSPAKILLGRGRHSALWLAIFYTLHIPLRSRFVWMPATSPMLEWMRLRSTSSMRPVCHTCTSRINFTQIP